MAQISADVDRMLQASFGYIQMCIKCVQLALVTTIDNPYDVYSDPLTV